MLLPIVWPRPRLGSVYPVKLKHGIVVSVALAGLLAGCGSSDSDSDDTAANTSATAAPDSGSLSCPTDAPAADTAPQWTLDGESGKLEMVGSTDSAGPLIKVTKPFKVTETTVKTLTEGTGPEVSDTATVTVCYTGVNGRDGNVFDSAYQRGEPSSFGVAGVVAGFGKALVGQKVGSTVGVAIIPADGYPDGQPGAGIEKDDTIVFAIKILAAQ